MNPGQIGFLAQAGCGYPGDATQTVQAGAVGSIVSGIPVGKALGQQYVLPLATNTPVVGTDYMAGISATLSTDTVAADGTVSVSKLVPNVTYLIAAKNPATVFGAAYATAPSQATYNTFIGKRVLFDLTSNVYTILNTDGSTNGLVIEYVDVTRYPLQVAFSIREAVSYQA